MASMRTALLAHSREPTSFCHLRIDMPGDSCTIVSVSAALTFSRWVAPTSASNITIPSSNSSMTKCCLAGMRQRGSDSGPETDGDSPPRNTVGFIKIKKRGEFRAFCLLDAILHQPNLDMFPPFMDAQHDMDVGLSLSDP